MSTDPIFRSYHVSQANQYGGDLPYFVGKQYGSGWLRTIAKVAFPIVKRIAGVAGRVAKDTIVKEKPLKQAIKTRALQEVGNFISGQSSSINKAQKRKATNTRNLPLFQQGKRPRRGRGRGRI